jgi:VCBS repeat-containing protein
LGLGHSYDIPTIMGGGTPNSVFPGDWDVVHLNRILPPNATDIDLYQFELPSDGTFTAETFAQRLPAMSYLDSVLTLFDAEGNVLARNDNYYSKDSFIEVPLPAGTYFVGVSSVGNEDYDPNIPDSGHGGRTDGAYRLALNFIPAPTSALVDIEGTVFDGDADGNPGGVFQFWFESSAQTIFVDKANDKTAGVVDGTGKLADPYDNIATAVRDAATRIVVPGRGDEVVRDGQIFQINDGIHPASVTFEIDRNGAYNSSHRQVDVSAASTPAQIAAAIKAAVDNAVLAGVLTNVTAVLSGNVVQLRGGANLRLDVGGSTGLMSGENVVRVLGNGGLDENAATLEDNRPYLIGTDNLNRPLADGNGVQVAQGTTLMIDAGALLKMRKANIDVGTSAVNANRAGGALQVLGTPDHPVRFRSYRDDSLGGNVDPTDPPAVQGDWGGLVFRNDSDQETQGIFLSWVTNADLQHGGGGVRVGSLEKIFTPIHLETARPTIAFNTIQRSADAAMSANPNSFDDMLGRIGPNIHGNTVINNSINGLFIRIETESGKTLDTLDVNARFDDTDIVHVITENLLITGNAGGPADPAKRLSGRLRIDPGTVVKLNDARIEALRGAANLIAEGTPGYRVIFTSAKDDRYGMGGTFDTNNDNLLGTGESTPWMGDWGGLMFNHVSSGSLDYALITFGGGDTPIEGGFAYFNAVEIHEANVRIANTAFETNANGRATPVAPAPAPAAAPGFSPGSGDVGGVAGGAGGLQYDTVPTGSGWAARNGRGMNSATTIYVIGAQPVIVQNTFLNNDGSMLWINANSLSSKLTPDLGRATGFADAFVQYADNRGPLVRLNRMDDNEINGMEIGAELLTVEGVWDDTDIAHVLQGEIRLTENYHTYSGLRLQSSDKESLVVKLRGTNAGFTINGKPLDIVDRVGSSMQVMGTPNHPVVLTSLYDCTVAAGYTLEGQPQTETLKGYACGAVVTTVPYADVIVVIDESGSMRQQQIFTETMIPQLEAALLAAGVGSGTAGGNQYGLVGFGGGGAGSPHSTGHAHPLGSSGQLWGTATEYVVAAGTLVTQSGSADGYYGIDYALQNYNFRPNAAKFMILVTDTFRESFGGVPLSPVTYAGLLTQLTAAGVTLETIVDARFRDGTGTNALAVDYAGTAYLADGSGGYTTATGGVVLASTVKTQYVDLGFATGGISGDINQIAVGGNTTASFSQAMIASIVAQTGSLNESAAGDWRSLRFEEYSNDRNVAVVNELEGAFSDGRDLNGHPLDAQYLGVLAPNEKSGDENRRLGFEVHGYIAMDDPRDRDVFSFVGTPGTEVWFDLDRTGSSLDAVVELVDENGSILARAVRNDQLYGIAQPLIANPLLVGDYYSHNFRDAGMRLLLPNIGANEGLYHVQVRSNGALLSDNGTSTNLAFFDNGALPDTITDSGNGFVTAGFTVGQQLIVTGTTANDGVYTIAGVTAGTITLSAGHTLTAEAAAPTGATLQVNHTSGAYRLQIRLRQLDEFPGSTVRYADIRYATNGIELRGLPGHSPLIGESAEVGTTSSASPQNLGNLLLSDQAALSLAGSLSSATNVDWYSFTVDHNFIQAIAGLNDGGKTIAAVFDIDYADGAQRADTTLAVFDAESGQLILVARDSNVEDDQPRPGYGTDTTDISRGSLGLQDPFIGLTHLREGNNRTYYVAVMSDQMLPTALTASMLALAGDANLATRLVRLEPINSIRRIVEDHIGFTGYHSGTATVEPVTGPLLQIRTATELTAHVAPFTLTDVQLYVSQGDAGSGGSGTALWTVNPFTGERWTRVTNGLGTDIQDIVMRSDGTLYGYRRLPGNTDNAGALVNISTDSGAVGANQADGILGHGTTPRDILGNINAVANSSPTIYQSNQVSTTDWVDALTYERIATQNDARTPAYVLYYAVREQDITTNQYSSKLYRANPNTGSAVPGNLGTVGGINLNYAGVLGDIQPAGVTKSQANVFVNDGDGNNGSATIQLEAKEPGDVTIQVNWNVVTNGGTSVLGVAGNTITVRLNRDNNGNITSTAQQIVDVINSNVNSRRLVLAGLTGNSSAGEQARNLGGPGVTVTGGTGIPLKGYVTGLAMGSYTGGTLYGVTSAGEFISINKNNGRATVIRDLSLDGITNFQGLALGPQNVEGGKYANTLFAITRAGDLYALDTATGTPQLMFSSGNTVQEVSLVNNPVGGTFRLSLDGTNWTVPIATTTQADIDVNEIQTVQLTNTPTGGTFRLQFQGQTTQPITFDAPLSVSINEVQQVALTGAPTGGSFRLALGAFITAPIAYDAPASVDVDELQQIVVTGAPTGGTFTLSYDGQTTAPISYDAESFAGRNEVQRIAATGAPTGGTFTLTFQGQTTSNIDFNADDVAVRAALVSLSNINPGDIVVTGGPLPAAPLSVEFQGQYARMVLPQMTIASAVTPGSIGVSTLQEGTPSVYEALTALPNIGAFDIGVGGGPLPGLQVTVDFAGGALAGRDVPAIVANPAGLTGGLSPNIVINTLVPGETSVQTRLAALGNIGPGNVIVTGGDLPGVPVLVEFVGALASTDINPLTADASALTGGAVSVTTIADGRASVLERLEGLANINPGDVIVTGGILPNGLIRVEFSGQYAGQDVPQMTALNNLLTGNPPHTIQISTTQLAVPSLQRVLQGIYPAGVTATGGPLNVAPIQVAFPVGNVAQMVADSSLLNPFPGSSAEVTTLPVGTVADAITVNVGVGAVTGLAFSPLDFNLWHPTTTRGSDQGHGINLAHDVSRVPSDSPIDGNAGPGRITGGNTTKTGVTEAAGGTSFYFGLERYEDSNVSANNSRYYRYDSLGQYGVVNGNVHLDLSSNPNIVLPAAGATGGTYNLPGGALGKLETNSFSLEPYAAADKPTLYFNYYLETENHAGSLTDTNGSNPFRDAARVFISTDGGTTWELVASNNSQLSRPTDLRGELPRFLSHTNTAGLASEESVPVKRQQVQELFDNTGSWRQARIDLSAYAGEADLQLRFDFTTAGTMNDPSQPRITPGVNNNNFGEFKNDTRSVRSTNNQYEGFYIDDIIVGFAERGEMVTTPSTTNNLGITNLGSGRTTNPDPTRYPRMLTGPYQLEVRRSTEFGALMDEAEPNIAIGRTYDTNERHVTGHTIVTPAGVSITDGITFTIVGRWSQVFEFNDINIGGVTPGRVAVNYTTNMTEDQVADSLRSAINSFNNTANFGVEAIRHTSTTNWVDLVGAKDLDTPTPLDVTLSADAITIYEPGTGPGGAATEAIITVMRQGADLSSPMIVNITALANGNRITNLPASVTIPAGQAFTTFTVGANVQSGDQRIRTVVLGGSVADPRYAVIRTTFNVSDIDLPDPPPLQMLIGGLGTETLDAEVGGRVMVTIGIAEPPYPINNPVPVYLVASDPRRVRFTDLDGNPITSINIPHVATIFPPGATGNLPIAYFYVEALATPFSAGTYPVTITAYANPFQGGDESYNISTGSVASVSDGVFVRTSGGVEAAYNRLGDSNRARHQGQVLIESNTIKYSAQAGIVVEPGQRRVWTDSGTSAVPNLPHPGPAINFVNLNVDRLAPGAVIQNNIIAYSGAQGISFRGTPTGTNPAGNVPFGRIVNNTIYGGANPVGQGILVNDNAAPTIMNNIIANTATAIQISGATAQTGTIVGYNLFQGNNAIGTAGSFAFTPVSSAPLFVDPLTNNFYLAAGTLAIDSSLNRMDDRDTFYWDVKNPLGIPPSAIRAPNRDVFGQQRKDDPFSDPLGGGSAVFKDRGAVDRVDFDGPYAQLLNPIDNDPGGVDLDRNATVVRLPNGLYTSFSIGLTDGPGDPLPPEGTGVRPSSVNAGTVLLTQNGVLLVEGRDFRLGYSPTDNTLLLTPLSGVWEPDSIYQVTLINQGAYAISDLAGNLLRGNQPSGAAQFTIILGEIESDYGDAPNSYGTLAASDGARHAVLPGSPLLGKRVDTEADGVPSVLADGDDNAGLEDDEDGVRFQTVLPGGGIQQGIFNPHIIATPVTVTVTGDGWLDAWVDFNGNGAFDANERVYFYDSEAEAGVGGFVAGRSKWLTNGEYTLWVVTPSWTSVKADGVQRYARFRLRPDVPGFDPTTPFAPTGLVMGGEVEDYTVRIMNVLPVVAAADTYMLDEDSTLDTAALAPPRSVFANDTNPGGGGFTAILVSEPAFGTLITSSDTVDFAASGHFQYIPLPDFSGTDTFTYRAADAVTGQVSNTIATVTITVHPKNDAPTIDLSALQTTPTGLTLSEDAPAGLAFQGIVVGDLVDDLYDPVDTELQLQLRVRHGGLSIGRTGLVTIAQVPADADGVAPLVDADPLVTTYQSVTLRGTIANLNAALNTLVYYGDEDFNTVVDDELLVIHVNDLGYSDQATIAHDPTDPQAMTARATLTLTVEPHNDPPVITLPANLNVTVAEDIGGTATDPSDPDFHGLRLLDGSLPPVGIVISDLDELLNPGFEVLVAAHVRYGGLVLRETAGLTFDVDDDGIDDRVPAADDGQQPLHDAVETTYQLLTFRGTLADVNVALASLEYYGDQDFNTGTLPELLVIEVNDLGNSDIRTTPGNIDPTLPWARTDIRTITLTVEPKNDAPEVMFVLPPGATNAAFINEGSTTGVVLRDYNGDGIRVADLDDIHDPRNIMLQVTLTAENGGMLLGTTTGLTIVSSTPAYNPPTDLVQPVRAGTSQVFVLRGTITDLNRALRTVQYFPDRFFNGIDRLVVEVNDLGNTDRDTPAGNLDPAVATALPAVPLTLLIDVGGLNDPPTIVLPPAQTVNEDTPLVFSAANVPPNAILVDDPDVLETFGGKLMVTLSVTNGTLTLPDVTGLTFPLDIDGDGVEDDTDLNGQIDDDEVAGIGFRQITVFGRPADLNAALDGMYYQGLLNFNGTDRLVIVVNDQGFTGVGTANEVRGTITITVAPVNDPPTVVVPGQRTGWEDTDLPIPGIVVGDAADEAYAGVILEVTLQAVHGTLRVRTDVPGGVVTVSNNNSNNVVLIGQPARINATLANATGVVYRGNQNFNDYSLDGNPDLNEQIVITVNDRGNVGTGGILQTKGTIPVSVRQVNDPPSILGPSQRTLAEDTTIIIPLIVQDVDADESPADPLRPVTVTLTLTDMAGQPLGSVGTLTVNPSVTGGIETGVNGLIEDNGTAVVKVSGSPAKVTATLASTNGLRYTPPANFNGRLALVAVVTDHGNSGATVPNPVLSASITISIQVDAVNDPPVAGHDTYATNEDTVLTVPAPGVLSNDYDVEGSPLTPRIITSTAQGTLTFNVNGSFTYVPKANFHGADTFTYRVNDGLLDSNLATVTITVHPVNDPPVAVNDSYIALEDTPLNVAAPGVLANDIDVDGDVLNPVVVTPPSLGVVSVYADGSFLYLPHANAHGVDTFTYRVNDGTVNSNLATVTITVTPVNDLPVAADNAYSTAEDTPLTIAAPGVLSNDVDVDGDPLTAQWVAGPANGTLVLNLNGSFTYTPALNYFGTDTFTYRAHDGQSGSAPATVTITVTPVNDRPVAVNDSYTIAEDTMLTVTAPGVLGNDIDVDGDMLRTVLVAGPQHGSLALNNDGSFTYEPNPDYFGPDSFTYRVNDSLLNSLNVATVAITVTPVNDVPVAIHDSYVTDEDQVLTVSAPGVLGNDTDADGDVLTVQLVDPPTAGVLTLNANGAFAYTPNPDFHGIDWFTYRARDAATASNVATVTITVNSVNDAPVAVNAAYVLDEDTVLIVAAPGLLAHAGDVDGDVLTAHLVGGPAHGVASVNLDGSFSYTPFADYHGPDSFTYRANDGQANSNVATIAITVRPVNDLPVAAGNSYTTNEDTLLTVAAPGVLGNDSDIDGDPLTASLVAPPAHGTLTLNANGSFAYLPNQDYHGLDGFTYRAHDGTGYSAVATVTITVVQVNDPPLAADDAYTTAEDTVLAIVAPGVKANDTDPDGNPFTVRLIDPPAHGTVVLAANGSFSYTPAANFHGTDRFTYRANDALADSNLATVTITVTPVNDPPLAADNAYTGLQDTPLVVTAPGILANDSDVDGDDLMAQLDAGPVNGTLALNSNGSFTYIPTAGFVGTDSFTYMAHDGTEASNVATVTITVTSTNDPPVAADDGYTTAEDTLLTVAVPGVLGNDTDADGNPLTALLISPPAAGILTLNNNGSFTYVPGADFHGTDTFTYRARDGMAESNLATVTITVTPVNDSPIAGNNSYTTAEDTPLVVGVATGVLSNDVDVDGDPLLVNLVTTVSHGTLVLNANGSFTYTPAADYHGSDSFTYRAHDGTASSNVATVTITVTPVNDPPLARPDSYATNEGTPVVAAAPGVLGNDLDVEGDTLTAMLVRPPSHGTLTLDADGSFVYTPWDNYNGTDSFTYTAHDGQLDSNVATVTITVAAVNDPPILTDNEGTTNEDEPMTFLASQLLGNARPGPAAPAGTADNEQSQTLTVIGVSPVSAEGGIVTLDPNTGMVTYTPPLDFHGMDTLTYRVTDDGLPPAEAIGTLTITVLPMNDPPRAVNDAYSVFENVVLNVGAPGVLANDYHPDGKSLAIQPQLVVSNQGVAVQVMADGRFAYDPTGKTVFRALNDGERATDTFTYQIADPDGRTARGTVTITVHGISDSPHHNPANPSDVSGDDMVSPLDALLVINAINTHGSGAIPAGMPANLYVDVNGDGQLTPGDALGVVNVLNAAVVGAGQAEGESQGIVEPLVDAAPMRSSTGMASVPITGAMRMVVAEQASAGWERAGLARSESDASGLDDWARELRDGAADLAATMFDGLEADYPGIDDALDDLLLEMGSTAAGEAATDELFGRLFG